MDSGDTELREDSVRSSGDQKPAYRADGKKYVEKGSLDESELIDARDQARGAKRKHEMTQEEKAEERRAANRLSAFQSRKRRIAIIEDLRKTVALISRENEKQASEILILDKDIQNARQENENLRDQLAKSGGADSSISSQSRPPPPASEQLLPPQVIAFLSEAIKKGTVSDEVVGLLNELVIIQQQLLVLQNNSEQQQQPLPGAAATTASVTPSPQLQELMRAGAVVDQQRQQDLSVGYASSAPSRPALQTYPTQGLRQDQASLLQPNGILIGSQIFDFNLQSQQES